MNEHLMEMMARDIVAALPSQKRDVYQYVVGIEDELASQSQTTEQFMSLLAKHTPHKQAASHFNMTYGQLMKIMREIETEIDLQLKRKIKKVEWVDCSDQFKLDSHKEMSFLLLI
ncbi:hypothetical protein D3H55_20010 [Bacillus salacetis]|uniref:Uncharacterized protein n=1 Tax=Bacillus salacetis TaxID=2315464 RepID=A0A3A1QPP3_9BACI|nr:hypothetical protein [Bacillus salacetis]RIW29010.1 hypothetical protein D3H55_20010 [Bacillus salacetis]